MTAETAYENISNPFILPFSFQEAISPPSYFADQHRGICPLPTNLPSLPSSSQVSKSELVYVKAAVLDGSYQQSLWLRSAWLRGRRAIPMEIRRFSRKEGVDGFFEPECVAA